MKLKYYIWFGIITLFPEMFRVITDYGVIGRSIKRGVVRLSVWNPRIFQKDQYQRVDDRPYGGGVGVLMTIKPLKDAINQAKNILGLGDGNTVKVIYLSPQGKRFNQNSARKLIYDNKKFILVCGRYQGIDERIILTEIDEEWSIGDYILSGGELAAMVLIDTIARLCPNVLGNQASTESDSFSITSGMLDHPCYTRPAIFENMKVPSVLLSGHHRNIRRWRLKQSLGRTWMKRPDLLNNVRLNNEEKILLAEFKNEYFSSLNR